MSCGSGGCGNNDGGQLAPPKKETMKIDKNDAEEPLIRGRRGPLTKEQFLYFVRGKFKTIISKHAQVKRNDNVIVGFSGGPGSRALLHMLYTCLNNGDSKKKMNFTVNVVHVDESSLLSIAPEKQQDIEEQIKEIVKNSGFNYHRVYIEDTFEGETQKERSENLREYINSFKSLSAKEDVHHQLIMNAITSCAKSQGIEKVLLGSTASRLAVKILAMTGKGRGFALAPLLRYMDRLSWPGATILRPMRIFLAKEVTLYNYFEKAKTVHVPTLLTAAPLKSSIEHLTEEFVNELQVEYPSTVFTILRAAEKLSVSNVGDDPMRCPLCHSVLSQRDKSNVDTLLKEQYQKKSSNEPSSASSSITLSSLACHGCRRMLRDRRNTQDDEENADKSGLGNLFDALLKLNNDSHSSDDREPDLQSILLDGQYPSDVVEEGVRLVRMERNQMRESIGEFIVDDSD